MENEKAIVTAAQAVAVSDTSDASEEAITKLLEEEGLSQREILRQIKQLLSADPSRLITIDADGNWKLRQKMLPKHALGIVEITPTKIKMVDKGPLLKLAVEVARMQPKKKEINNNLTVNRPVVVALPPQISRAEAFADVIEVEAKEVK
jgi:hypothetical protein